MRGPSNEERGAVLQPREMTRFDVEALEHSDAYVPAVQDGRIGPLRPARRPSFATSVRPCAGRGRAPGARGGGVLAAGAFPRRSRALSARCRRARRSQADAQVQAAAVQKVVGARSARGGHASRACKPPGAEAPRAGGSSATARGRRTSPGPPR